MVNFKDFDYFPGMIKVFRPVLGKSLDKHTSEAFDEMKRQWEQGNNALGEPWAPLAESTVRQKGHDRPLIETRDMINSAERKVDRGELQVEFSIDVEYAGVHEFGAPDQNVPARPIMQPALELAGQNMNSTVRQAVDRSVKLSALGGVTGAIGMGGGTDIRGGGR